jgi:hypothetical protein
VYHSARQAAVLEKMEARHVCGLWSPWTIKDLEPYEGLACGHVGASERPSPRATGTPLSQGIAPNDVRCADYKGEFQLGNRSW